MKETSSSNAIETLLCGGCAGLVSRFFIAPLDVLKIRLQLQSSGEKAVYTGILQGFQQIIRKEGITGLWKGNVSAEWLYVTYSASQFLTYTQLTRFCQRYLSSSSDSGVVGVPVPESTYAFIAGAGAGAVATTLTYPFDLFRTRFAAQSGRRSGSARAGGGSESKVVYSALRHAFGVLLKDEGWRGMYRGLGASILQIVPYMGLLFGTYEPTRAFLVREGVPSGWDAGVAGLLAGSISKTGVFPLDLIRKRLQVQGPTRMSYFLKDIPEYSGIRGTIRKVWKVEGVTGFYKGLGVSLLKSAPSSAITLWTFEQSSKLLKYVERRYEALAE